MSPRLAWDLDHAELIVGWVQAEAVTVAPAPPALREQLRRGASEMSEEGRGEEVRTAIRDLLRGHGYKPAGRGKPASEFLARAAARGELAEINNIVDCNNLVSLQTGMPASVFDLERADPEGRGLALRYGRPGERLVFNRSGQEIDVTGLLGVVRHGGGMLGNPVKDSMIAKIHADTKQILAVVYTSRRLSDAGGVQRVVDEYAALLRQHAGAGAVASGVQWDPAA